VLTPDRDDAARPRNARYWAVVLGAVFLCLYILSASWTVILDHDDAALFQAVGVAGGVPHQPYPLWCLLARAFSLIPIGEPAFRVTLMSIVFASLTIGILFMILVRLTGTMFVSAMACAALGLSYTFWANAVVAEVYAMNAFLFVVFVYLAIRVLAKFDRSLWIFMMLVLGLLISHHQTNVFLLGVTGLIVYWKRHDIRGDLSARHWLAGAGVFLLPFTLFLYTYFVDKGPLPVNWLDGWGQHLNAAQGGTPEQFVGFFDRMRFQMFIGRFGPVLPDLPGFIHQAYDWVRMTVAWEFPFVAIPLIAIGFFSSWKRNSGEGLFWLSIALPFVFAGIVIFGGGDTLKYSIPAYIVFTLYLALGFRRVRHALSRWGRMSTPIMAIVAVLVVAAPLLRYSILRQALINTTTEESDPTIRGRLPLANLRCSNNRGQVYGDWVSRHVQPGSLILGDYSSTNVLIYRKHALGELAGVDVDYFRPTKESTLNLIRDANPKHLYLTRPPESYGLVTGEVLTIVGDFKLYRVSMNNQVERTAAE